MNLKISDEYSDILPPLTADEYNRLKTDIAEHGVLVPIEIDEDGVILDGHHRYKAWGELTQAGIDVDFLTAIRVGLSPEEKSNHARVLNLTRRHLSREQLEHHWKRMREDGMTYEAIGKATGVSKDTVQRAVIANEKTQPEYVTGKDGKRYRAQKTSHKKNGTHISNNTGNSEWYTPSEYIAIAKEVMGGVDTDPASTEKAQETVQAACYYTQEEDGLSKEWRGRVWLNPPYAQPLIELFACKMIDEYQEGFVTEGMVLVNNATETKWFQLLLHNSDAVLFPFNRVRFLTPEGVPGSPLQGQALIYFGCDINAFKDACLDKGEVLFR